MSEPRRYEIGHRENGHVLGPDGQWHPEPGGSGTSTQTLPAPAAAPSRAQVPTRRRWLAPTLIGVGAFVLGTVIGNAGGDTPAPADAAPAEPTPVTETQEYRDLVQERDGLESQVEQLQDQVDGLEADAAEADAAEAEAAEADAAEQAAAPAGLTNGQYIVGTTIEPGRYTMVVEDGAFSMGYVDQQDGDTYLAQEVGNEAGATIVVDIVDVPGSIVEFSGVTQITKIG